MLQINRQELYTSLKARIKFLQTMMDFGPDDVAALAAGSKYFKAMIPDLTDKVYGKLLSMDITARVFDTHDSRVEEDPDEWQKLNDKSIQNRKIFLRWYFIKIITNVDEPGYWEYLDKVGRLHVGGEKQQAVVVEYVLLGSCLGYIHGLITEKVLAIPDVDLPTKTAVLKAINKIIWIQNDLLARYHVREEDYVVGDSHGSLRTKNDGSETTSLNLRADEAGTDAPGVCPFSGRSRIVPVSPAAVAIPT